MDAQIEKSESRRKLPTWIVVAAFGVLFAFLALIAWGLKQNQAGPILVGQKVPAIELITFDGEVHNTANYAGQVIVLNFWASWCKPCEQEAAELEEAWKKYAPQGKVVFLGVDYVDTEPEARKYLEQFAITYPNGPDLRTKISQMFRIRGVPETYIIGPDGTLKYVKVGPFASVEEIDTAINTAFSQP